MNSSRGDYLYCHNCGMPNALGERACARCRLPLYYNCPECAAFVDNTFSNCPACGRGLNWPATGTYYDRQYAAERPSSPAAFILITCIILLLVIGFGLAIHNSNSVTAVSNPFTVTSSNAQTADTPQVQTSASGSPVSITPAPRYSYYPGDATSGQSTASGEAEITLPAAASTSGTGSSTVRRSDYMDSVYPGWGHCSGGRCGGSAQ